MDPSSTWDATIKHYSGYSEAILAPCVAALRRELHDATAMAAPGTIRRKYASPKLGAVSELKEITAFLSRP